MEILERMEDLQEEGIATAAKRGAKLKVRALMTRNKVQTSSPTLCRYFSCLCPRISGRRHLGRRHFGRRHLGRRHFGRRHFGRRHLRRRHQCYRKLTTVL